MTRHPYIYASLIRRLAAGSFIFFSCTGIATRAPNIDEYCDTEYESLSDDTKYPGWGERIEHWISLESKCGGNARYELRLAALYSLADRVDEAREALKRGLRTKSVLEKDLRLSLFDLDLRQGRLVEAEERALALIKEFPDWRGGHRALGQILMTQERFEESVSELELANKLEANAGTYTLLTMAYYKLGRYRESARSMQQALRLDRSKLTHTDAVLATAYSLVALGYTAQADDLLKKHAAVQPKALQVPAYAEAVRQVQAASAKTSN